VANEATEPLKITLDIAATLSAIVWPIVVVVILYLFRERIPALLKELASRVTKLDIAGVTLEFAKAKAFVPSFASATADIDLRQRASAMQVSDSTAGTFLSQLRDPTSADYAIVNLGAGDQWLTSRLYIMTVVFARMKGLTAFVFLGQSSPSRRYLGWADPNTIRWALARKYPWLEAAYAAAYSDVVAGPNSTSVVASSTGRLGYQFNPGDPEPSIKLLKAFLQRIQWPPEPGAPPLVPPPLPAPPSLDAPGWVLINETSQTREHATWLTSTLIEDILSEELSFSHVGYEDLQGKSRGEQVRLVLAQTGRYVAVTREDLRFEYLIDRSLLLEQVAQGVIAEGDKS
jgi:hypothetical protein